MALHSHLTLTVSKTAHYAFLGDPNRPATECWYVCHGYAQLAHRFLRRFQALESATRWVVAPEGLSRFYVRGAGGHVGASWMTREDREVEIHDYVGFLDALHDHLHESVRRVDGSPVRTTVLGFSQGCATASRWAARGAVPPSRLILWGEVQAHDLTGDDLRRLREARVPVHFIIGRQDETVALETVERAASALAQEGLVVDTHVFDGGHEIDEAALLRVSEVGVED